MSARPVVRTAALTVALFLFLPLMIAALPLLAGAWLVDLWEAHVG